jgi:hypothetical protein
VKAFTAFAGVERPEEMRQVTRAHLIAWRKDLERRGLAPYALTYEDFGCVFHLQRPFRAIDREVPTQPRAAPN